MTLETFYQKILNPPEPWIVSKVKLEKTGHRVNVWLTHEKHALRCPECGVEAPIYDHMPERVLQHLDTCGRETCLHVKLPRVKCPVHGVKAVAFPFAGLNEAVNRQFPNGIREAEWLPHLISDNGCQPTSKAFHAACRDLGIEQIFASYSNPKGNADTERVIRTLKEDLVWAREFDSIQAFESALKQWVQDYNEEFPHSALGYETPNDYERWFYASLSK